MSKAFHFDTTQKTTVALLTKHAKGTIIAPKFAALNLKVIEIEGYDTDLLGTFSGEIERTLSPVECARKKAKLACELSGADYGLGSEGSFGGGPLPGIVNWNTEHLVLHHAPSQLEIIAKYETSVAIRAIDPAKLESINALESELAHYDSNQGWIIKSPKAVLKGIVGAEDLHHQLSTLLSSGTLLKSITIEPDFRAMHCPERQASIEKAAEQMVERLKTRCPECNWPNFWQGKPQPGLPCEICEMPTSVAQSYEVSCDECGHVAVNINQEQRAKAELCQWCNP
ncbi:MAG: hypothetical protein HWE27_09015 [Gammaproteobacteria bacterium]|nr:hypothetical protein [Gammaproteobacteria bacterium]